MVVKATKELAEILSGGYSVAITNPYRLGNKWEDIPVGKVALSIKSGKSRKLVPGRIVCEGMEAGGFGHPGYDLRRFVPNNPEKFQSLMNNTC